MSYHDQIMGTVLQSDNGTPLRIEFVLVIIGFGRAGQLRFKGDLSSPRCRLKYVVEDEVEKAKRQY